MYPYFHIILPSYAVLAFIGGVITLIFSFFIIDKFHLKFTDLLKTAAFGAFGVLIGSKLLYSLTQIEWIIENFSLKNVLMMIVKSGFVFYGGLLGLIAAVLLLTKKDKETRKNMFLLLAFDIPLFHFFGRIGCFLAGCCYGRMLRTPITFVNSLEIDRFPIQLMEAAYELFLFIAIVIIYKKNKMADLFKIYMIMYALFRFTVEFLRDDEIRGIFFGLSTSQWISVAIILFYIIRLMKKNRLKKVNKKFESKKT